MKIYFLTYVNKLDRVDILHVIKWNPCALLYEASSNDQEQSALGHALKINSSPCQ